MQTGEELTSEEDEISSPRAVSAGDLGRQRKCKEIKHLLLLLQQGGRWFPEGTVCKGQLGMLDPGPWCFGSRGTGHTTG